MYYYCIQAYSFIQLEKGRKKKIYIYIYIYMRCAKVFPFTAVTCAQTRCRTLCANSQCSSDLVYAWNINSTAQRAITFRLKSTFISLQSF